MSCHFGHLCTPDDTREPNSPRQCSDREYRPCAGGAEGGTDLQREPSIGLAISGTSSAIRNHREWLASDLVPVSTSLVRLVRVDTLTRPGLSDTTFETPAGGVLQQVQWVLGQWRSTPGSRAAAVAHCTVLTQVCFPAPSCSASGFIVKIAVNCSKRV